MIVSAAVLFPIVCDGDVINSRPAFVTTISNTSRAKVFLLFTSKDVAAPRGAQIRSDNNNNNNNKPHCINFDRTAKWTMQVKLFTHFSRLQDNFRFFVRFPFKDTLHINSTDYTIPNKMCWFTGVQGGLSLSKWLLVGWLKLFNAELSPRFKEMGEEFPIPNTTLSPPEWLLH